MGSLVFSDFLHNVKGFLTVKTAWKRIFGKIADSQERMHINQNEVLKIFFAKKINILEWTNMKVLSHIIFFCKPIV